MTDAISFAFNSFLGISGTMREVRRTESSSVYRTVGMSGMDTLHTFTQAGGFYDFLIECFFRRDDPSFWLCN